MCFPIRSSIIALCAGVAISTESKSAAPYIPRYDHVVIVIMSTKSNNDILASASAPYINGTLITTGASFNASYALADTAQPNYIALFSGSSQGVTDETCPETFSVGSLAQQLVAAGLSFIQYSEDMPSIGYTSCGSGLYARKHNPVPDFTGVSVASNQPYTNFSGAIAGATLPTITFVVPNLCNDMHGDLTSCNLSTSGLVALGDLWLQNNLPQYLTSASAQNGLLIVTWDQGGGNAGYAATLIPTIFLGPHVKPDYVSSTVINHYSVLRTLEDMYGLTALGNASATQPITDIWDAPIFEDGFEP